MKEERKYTGVPSHVRFLYWIYSSGKDRKCCYNAVCEVLNWNKLSARGKTPDLKRSTELVSTVRTERRYFGIWCMIDSHLE